MEDIWLVGKYIPLFPESSNLPTYNEVFRKFMFHLRAEKQTAKSSAQLTTQALKASWNKKHLNHLLDDRTVQHKILRYYEIWRSLQKRKLRMSAKEAEKRKDFSDSFQNLFDIGTRYKPKNKKEKEAFRYLQEQRELTRPSESGPKETISCSDFEEEETATETNAPTSEQESKILTASDFESSSQTQSESVPSISTIGEDLQIPGKCQLNSFKKCFKMYFVISK